MVYLNGWELEYTGSDDHHVKGLGVWITKVRQENNVLHWEAGGVLTDKNADDPYRVCYYYTVVMWDTDIIDAYVIQDNFEHTQTFVHEDSQTAGLRVLAGEHDGPPAPWVVPRGFGLMFTGDTVDHHLLQVAFRLDDTLLWNIPLFDRIFWESAMILKDNSTRSFIGTEMVSIVGGLRVSIRQGKNIALRPRSPAITPYPCWPGGISDIPVEITRSKRLGPGLPIFTMRKLQGPQGVPCAIGLPRFCKIKMPTMASCPATESTFLASIETKETPCGPGEQRGSWCGTS
jgi:hypothetical protein